MIIWMENKEIDILLTQELNANVEHTSAKLKISEVLQRHPGVQYIASQTHSNTETEHKPGGTALWINPLLSRHICNKLQDPLGRWTGVKLKMKTGKILILSIYQPITKKIDYSHRGIRSSTRGSTCMDNDKLQAKKAQTKNLSKN
jgi:hypothetical protein